MGKQKGGGNILVACYEPLPQNSAATEESHESPVSIGSASVTIETCCLQNNNQPYCYLH